MNSKSLNEQARVATDADIYDLSKELQRIENAIFLKQFDSKAAEMLAEGKITQAEFDSITKDD
ncbi:hypothetical protein [Cupriavidus sp. IK-TO18]|uniref:hypothetical protein n=1 Tax=Cupriavidus sp. IK-TO18 TaxID=2782182 RepID=UPI00189B7673|nr:hypothetical protein [Cupriavidus sp. IK-TO18]MBF6987209.1 hypothetical protein [Cupriavidus sp. IK-TO18]